MLALCRDVSFTLHQLCSVMSLTFSYISIIAFIGHAQMLFVILYS